jgi:hypothetical protein
LIIPADSCADFAVLCLAYRRFDRLRGQKFIKNNSDLSWDLIYVRGVARFQVYGIEVLVKAEHDFYREKWQKEKEQN